MKNELRKIITDYGLKIIEEPKRFEAIINDLLITESKSDLFAIKFALQQGLVNELMNKGKDFIHLFKHKLMTEYNTTEEKAIFTTEIWVFALFNENIKITGEAKTEITNGKTQIKSENNTQVLSTCADNEIIESNNTNQINYNSENKGLFKIIKSFFTTDTTTSNTSKPIQNLQIIKPTTSKPIQNLQIIKPNNNYEPEMVFVEGGTFMMGSNEYENEKPIHGVTLNSFYIGKYQTTQKQWVEIMGNNPSRLEGESRPVESVSWNDVQNFIIKLNQKTGKNYRLPTEAEWEYAARGGINSKGYKYAGSNNIDEIAWYNVNSSDFGTHPVGTKAPNELGIYDMSGNVWEWCQDWYDKNYYMNSPKNNPKGPENRTCRVLRGGSWYVSYGNCRSACRNFSIPSGNNYRVGLRIAEDL